MRQRKEDMGEGPFEEWLVEIEPIAVEVRESAQAKDKLRGKAKKKRGTNQGSPSKSKKLETLSDRQHAACMLLFQKLDADGSAVLDQNEIKTLDSDAWRDLDANNDGEIDITEWITFMCKVESYPNINLNPNPNPKPQP